jgi:hypothetical protein
MREQRVVDLYFSGSQSYGSGYLLSDRLILTARHVAIPALAETPCIARRWKLVDRHLDARVEWLSEEHDVALIRLDTPVTDDLGEPPCFGRCPEQSGPELYDCVGIGFPRASRGRENQRVDTMLSGDAKLSFRSDLFDVTPRGAIPADPRLWAGFSGAALFSRQLLFAVVSNVPEDWDGRALNAVAIDRLLDDEGFRRALSAGGFPDPPTRGMRHSRYYGRLSDEIAKYYFFVDRQPQEAEFRESLPEGRRSFIVPGETQDRPDLLMTRFANDDEFKRIVGDMGTVRTIELLIWPKPFRIDRVDAQFEALKESCAKALGIVVPRGADARTFAEALEDRGAAGVWWKISPRDMGPGHADLLKRWTDFCAEVETGPSPFFWFCCWLTDASQSDVPDFLADNPDPGVRPLIKQLVEGGKLINLRKLDRVDVQAELRPWIEQLAVPTRLDSDGRRDLEERLEPELGMASLPLGDFVERVTTILRGEDGRAA